MHERKYKYQITKQKLIEYAKELPENTPLPNRNLLAGQCGVARVTLERAISELIGEGILISEDGRGTYVAKKNGNMEKEKDGNSFWALLVYNVTKGMTSGILRGVEDVAGKYGRHLIICNTDNDPQKETKYLRSLLEQPVEGIVLIPNTHSVVNGEVLQALEEKGVSVVACSRQIPGYDYPGTFQNFFLAGFLATQHLLQLGCRRIAYLATSRYSTIEARLQGYLAALEQHNAQHPGDLAHEALGLSDITGDIGELFEEFLCSHPEIDGIYVFNDRLAMILYKVLEKLGRLPGKDIRIIASDASDYSSAFSTPLSTVDFSAYEMGTFAAKQLGELIQEKLENQNKHIVLSCELNARASTLGI